MCQRARHRICERAARHGEGATDPIPSHARAIGAGFDSAARGRLEPRDGVHLGVRDTSMEATLAVPGSPTCLFGDSLAQTAVGALNGGSAPMSGRAPSGSRRRTHRRDPDPPRPVAAAVVRNATALWIPCKFLRCGVVQNAPHRASREIEEPHAISEHLEDDPFAIRRDGRRPDEMARPWRAKGLAFARSDIRDDEPVLMAVTQPTAVRKPRGTPDLSDSKRGLPRQCAGSQIT